MPTNKLILKLYGNKIYYCEDKYVLIDNTTIGFNIRNQDVGFPETVYWETEILLDRIDKITKSIALKIIDCQTGKTELFENQKPKMKLNYIGFINFIECKDEIFTQLSTTYDIEPANEKLELPFDIEEKTLFDEDQELEEQEETTAQDEQKAAEETITVEELEHTIKQKFSINITDCTFGFNHISFEYPVDELNRKLTARIYNDHLMPHFEYIKQFFPKALGLKSKKISGIIYVNMKGDNIESVNGFSPAIKNINEEVINVARTLWIEEPTKKVKPPQAKIILEAEDIFAPENSLPDFTPPAPDELIDNLDRENIRNVKQLEYLSGKLQSPKNQLKFTLKTQKDNFGFLFFLTVGEKMYHFVWELLNSNATYIWSFAKDEYRQKNSVKEMYERMEQTLSFIENFGRTQYISDYKSKTLDSDILFNRIIHKHINSPIDHFPEWKNKLNKHII